MSQDRYEIISKLGEGGAGSVYRALDTRLNREVAIKRVLGDKETLSQESINGLLAEARILSSFTHPNIITVYDADVDEEGPFVVMELLEGDDIDKMIESSTLTLPDFQDFATQCLEALTAAHSYNILHRDIKPNNIVIKWLPSGKFQAKLLDFGMAKFSKEPSKQTVDHGDSVLGSIYFMAPEQFERIELDSRTDLYSLGSVLYYTLTGEYPFTGDTPAQVMAAHLTHNVKPLTDFRPDIPQWVNDWILWLVNRNKDDRPESAKHALDLFFENLDNDPLKQTGKVPVADLKPSGPQLITGNIKVQANQYSKPGSQPQKTTTAQAINPAVENDDNAPSGEAVVLPTLEDIKPPKAYALLYPIMAVVVVALLTVGVLLVYRIKENERVAALNALLIQVKEVGSDIPTSSEDLEIMLGQLFFITGQFDNAIIYNRLVLAKSSDGTDIDDRLARFAVQTERPVLDEVRRSVFRVLGYRKNTDIIPIIKEYISTIDDNELAASAIESIDETVTPADLHFFLDTILSTDSMVKRSAAEKASTNIIKSNTEAAPQIATNLNHALQKTDTTISRAVVLRLLGHLGGENAKKTLLDSLASGDSDRIIPSLAALQDWPDASMTEVALNFWKDNTDEEVRPKAFTSIFTIMTKHHLDNAEGDAYWKTLVESANNSQERNKIINGLANTNREFALPLLNKISQDSDKEVSSRAKKASTHLKKILN